MSPSVLAEKINHINRKTKVEKQLPYHPCKVYLPTFGLFFCRKYRYVNIYHTWIVWECHQAFNLDGQPPLTNLDARVSTPNERSRLTDMIMTQEHSQEGVTKGAVFVVGVDSCTKNVLYYVFDVLKQF